MLLPNANIRGLIWLTSKPYYIVEKAIYSQRVISPVLWKNAIIPKLTQKPFAAESQSQLKAIYCRKLITTTDNFNRKPLAHKNQLLTKAIRYRMPIALQVTTAKQPLSLDNRYYKPTATASQSLFNEITSLST